MQKKSKTVKKPRGSRTKQPAKPQKKPPDKTDQKRAASEGIRGAHAVKLVKIKNKYMFTPTEKTEKDYKPNGVHTYIVFKDAAGYAYAIRTTHLYERKKQDQIEKNILMALKLPGIKYPSGVRCGIIAKDVEGKELDLSKVHAVNIKGNRGTYLTKKQSEKVINFANKTGKKKKKP